MVCGSLQWDVLTEEGWAAIRCPALSINGVSPCFLWGRGAG